MQVNKFRFTGVMLILTLTLIQYLINQNTTLYLDIIGVLSISVMLTNNYSLTTLTIVSLFADLIGRWYLGTHLLAGLVTSLFTGYFINFYSICNIFQKSFFASIFYLIMLLVISLIGYITNNITVHFVSFIINVIFICPITIYIVNRYTYKDSNLMFI